MAKRKTCACGKPSIPGLLRDVALCQEHYNALMFKTGPEHREAVAMRYAVKGAPRQAAA